MTQAKLMSKKSPSIAQASKRRTRIISLVQELPEGTCVSEGNHLSLEVRGKRFGWYLNDHHGDGRLALNCKAPRGAQKALVSSDPEYFHVPKYVGRHGWIGLWLDQPQIDWTVVRSVLKDAYVMTAPKYLWQSD